MEKKVIAQFDKFQIIQIKTALGHAAGTYSLVRNSQIKSFEKKWPQKMILRPNMKFKNLTKLLPIFELRCV